LIFNRPGTIVPRFILLLVELTRDITGRLQPSSAFGPDEVVERTPMPLLDKSENQNVIANFAEWS
jgi:hypothetical protein